MDYQSYEATITSIVDESPSVKSFGMSLSGPNFDFFLLFGVDPGPGSRDSSEIR